MNSVARSFIKIATCVILVCVASPALFARNDANKESKIVVDEEAEHALSANAVIDDMLPSFSWSADRKLTWDDFKGPVDKNVEDDAAAATWCGLGFESTVPNMNGEISIKVYNHFYPSKSWVKAGQLKSGILSHEQCHFDICELYTRLLRKKLTEALAIKDVSTSVLKKLYREIQSEYNAFQDMYEEETMHGTIGHVQQTWEYKIAEALKNTEL